MAEKMRKKIFLFLPLIFVFLSLTINLVLAVPWIPHQFYGYVEVNDQPVPDNTVIIATCEGDEYTTITTNSKYGYAPNIFYVEDPEGDRSGSTITFEIGGMEVGTYEFENNGYTKLDFPLTTTCGDGYCLGDETCSTCSQDCGECTGAPIIIIHSPESKTYADTKIDLEVSADQDILVWMYSLNDGDLITFSPNIIITLEEGNHSLTVVGINNVYQSGSSAVSFSVELPQIYCGNGVCDEGEDCSSCPQDCGECSSGGGSSGGGSSGGGGGGSSAAVKEVTSACTEKWTCTKWSECSEDGIQVRTCFDENNCGTTENKPIDVQGCKYTKSEKSEDETTEEETEEETTPTGMNVITGAAIGTITGIRDILGKKLVLISLIIVLALLSIFKFVFRRKS